MLELGCGGGTAESRQLAARFMLTRRRSLDGAAASRAGADPERRVPPRRPRHHRVRRRVVRRGLRVLLAEPPAARITRRALRQGAFLAQTRRRDARLARRRRPGRLGGRMARRAHVLLELPGRDEHRARARQPVSMCWRTRSSASTSRKVLSSSSGSSPGDELRLLTRPLPRALARGARRRLPLRRLRPAARARRADPAARRRPLPRRRTGASRRSRQPRTPGRPGS